MARLEVQTHGFAELEEVLVNELPKATAKNVLRRTAITASKPVKLRAKQLAPKEDGTLAESIDTKPVKAKYVKGSRTRREAASGITVATGPTSRKSDSAGGNAAWQEFGTVNMPANPYMRPASDYETTTMLDIVRDELTLQIEKAKKRMAAKAARKK